MSTSNSKANGESGPEKFFGNFNLDFGAALANQRKTMAALAQIGEIALTGAQEVQKRQVELVKRTVDGFAAMVADLVQPSSMSRDWVEKQAETSKKALANTLASAREMTDVLTQAQVAAFGVWTQRVSEGLGGAGLQK